MHYRIEFKQYLARFKKIKKLVSAQNFELQLMNDVVTRQKVIALQTVETKVSSDLKIQFAIETEDLRCHNIAKFVAYVQE